MKPVSTALTGSSLPTSQPCPMGSLGSNEDLAKTDRKHKASGSAWGAVPVAPTGTAANNINKVPTTTHHTTGLVTTPLTHLPATDGVHSTARSGANPAVSVPRPSLRVEVEELPGIGSDHLADVLGRHAQVVTAGDELALSFDRRRQLVATEVRSHRDTIELLRSVTEGSAPRAAVPSTSYESK